MDQSDSNEFLTINEAARALGVNPRTVYRHVWSGKLAARRLGESGKYLIRRADLEAFLSMPRAEEPEDSGAAAGRVLRCGSCLRVLPSMAQVAATCQAQGCGEPLCASCVEEGHEECLGHRPSAEDRLRLAAAQLKRGEIGVLVRASEARLREISLLSRLRSRLSAIDTLVHPLSGELLTVRDWSASLEEGDDRAEVMRLLKKVYLDKEILGQVPLNIWMAARLSLPRGAKGGPFEIQIRSVSRLERMLREGFDTAALDSDTLAGLLVRLAEGSSAEPVYRLVMLASPTGWDEPARRIIQGDENNLAFIHTSFQVYLFDVPRGELIYNQMEEHAVRYSDLFVPSTPGEEVEEAARAVEKEMLLYDSLTLEHAASVLTFRQEVILLAFQRLAKQGRYTLIDVPRLGQAIVRK